MVNKKVSIRLIWSEAIESASPCGVRAHDWSDHGRAHVGDTKNRSKNMWIVNHVISECEHNHMQSECIVVDWWCRGSKGKAKIEGYMSVSDEEAHHHCYLSTWKHGAWLIILFVHSLEPSIWGWYAVDIFSFNPQRMCKVFQKWDINTVRKRQYQWLKNKTPKSSVVMSTWWGTHGMQSNALP